MPTPIDSSSIKERLLGLTPEAMRRFGLAVARPLIDVAIHEGFETTVAASMKPRFPPGGIDALFTLLVAGPSAEAAAEVIRGCESLERAAGRHRVPIRSARLYETAAYVLAHATGVVLHRRVAHLVGPFHEDPIAAIAFYVLDRVHGIIPEGEVRTLSGQQVADAYAHRWASAESARHLELAGRAERDSLDALLRTRSLFADDVRAGVPV
jgi:hypothetical protein